MKAISESNLLLMNKKSAAGWVRLDYFNEDDGYKKRKAPPTGSAFLLYNSCIHYINLKYVNRRA